MSISRTSPNRAATNARAGRSTAGCPGWAWCPDETWTRVRVRLRGGQTLDGYLRKQQKHGPQLQTLDGRLRLLARDEYDEVIRIHERPGTTKQITAAGRRDLLAFLSRRVGVPLGPSAGGDPIPPAASVAPCIATAADRPATSLSGRAAVIQKSGETTTSSVAIHV